MPLRDIQDEIFDMVKPHHPHRISLNDLINCGQGEVVVNILIDLNGFWTHENRETLVTESSSTAAAAAVLLTSTPPPPPIPSTPPPDLPANLNELKKEDGKTDDNKAVDTVADEKIDSTTNAQASVQVSTLSELIKQQNSTDSDGSVDENILVSSEI